ncbi:MAG: serine hydrolase domain-containing protein [Chlamydiota bacterium]
MSMEHSFNLSLNVDGQKIETLFTESDPSSSGAVQIGKNYYTYNCAAAEEKISSIITKALESHPETVSAFQTNVYTIMLPSTPAGKLFSLWLNTFNSGDYKKLDTLRAYVPEPENYDTNADFYLYFQTGGFDLIKIEESTPNQITCLVREKCSDQYLRITLGVENNLMKNFFFDPIDPPPGYKIEKMSEKEMIQATEKRALELTEKGLFSGALLIAKNGQILYSFAGGKLPEISKKQDPLDITFNMGSMNKMFTAVAIMQLVQQGLLSLNTPIGDILKNHPQLSSITIHPDVAKITLQQLLTHTGGVGDTFGPEAEAIQHLLKSPKDYIEFYNERGLVTPVGEYHYSNHSFMLLGAAIEAISQENYYNYIQKNILDPAEMHSTDFHFKTKHVENMASGYMRDFEKPNPQLEVNDSTLPIRGTPAGGGYSTPNDMLRFANALESHRLLDAAYTKKLIENLVETSWKTRYGYGFLVAPQETNFWFGHTGTAPGVNCSFKIYPDAHYTVIVMSNLDYIAGERIATFIENRLS